MVSNDSKMSLPLQLFMIHSDYDQIPGDNYISATALLKPIKSTILSRRVEGSSMDLLDLVAAAVGTASHDRLEKSFLKNNYIKNMHKLGIPQNVINRVRINPEKVDENDIPIYLEKRTVKKLGKWKIGGKFDFVAEGTVRDLKTTKVFSWMKGDFNDYIMQGSIYRWLNPDIITEDIMYIDFIFTDWKAHEQETKAGYPQYAAQSKPFNMMSYDATEVWLRKQLTKLEYYWDKEQSELPKCNRSELWQNPEKYAYYKNPLGKRATKVFESLADANIRLNKDGNVGKIDTRRSTPKRCNYCSAKPICHQAQDFILLGLLEE